MKVLDLCAAPGGKSTMLRSLLPDDALVVSNELVFDRSQVLVENVSRWGYANVIVTQGPAERFLKLAEHFDVVLLDAPCSGEGMFRKDPDAMAHWSPKLVHHSAEIQLGLLEVALTCVKPGGKVIFSTCTFNHIENEGVLERLAERHPESFAVEPIRFPESWGLRSGISCQSLPETRETVHAYPHCCKGEGFYLACLIRQDRPVLSLLPSKPATPQLQFPRGKQPALPLDWLKGENWAWAQDPDGIWIAFPSWMEEEVRLLNKTHSIVKAGVRVAAESKATWIPDQELAWCLNVGDAIPKLALSHQEALRFMKREAPSADGTVRGWHLATYQGVGMGWLKGIGNRWNVHLPKNLRIRNNIEAWL